ncbi:hypothetical protein GCM10020369_74380 [Cryptosporangium minutisporangium]|uniref:Serine/threonine protein kinase n=1 Tax=Cryptosporangium minutisporangium TaxID=113569 RepID=A0ABP6T9E4_9ACTN
MAGAAALVLGVTTIIGAVALNPGADQSVAGTTTVGDESGRDTGAPTSPRVDGSAATGTPTDGATPTGSPTGTPQPSASPSKKKPAATESSTPGSTPAKNPYTAAEVCGSGYRVVDSASLKKSSGTVAGTVYLLFSKSSGRNCVVTLKRTSIGKKTSATAYLQVKGKTKVAETGKFAYYAGPIRAAAAATCVKWGGSAGGVRYDSPYEHCG